MTTKLESGVNLQILWNKEEGSWVMLTEGDWQLFAAACEIVKRVNIHIAESVPLEPPDPRAVAFFHEFVSGMYLLFGWQLVLNRRAQYW